LLVVVGDEDDVGNDNVGEDGEDAERDGGGMVTTSTGVVAEVRVSDCILLLLAGRHTDRFAAFATDWMYGSQ
jgi:copper oxidase (laccase) domain-containing protein